MHAHDQTKNIPSDDKLLAPFLVLLVGKLTGWNLPTPGGGDPSYLTSEQAAALAAEGVRLLSSYLPDDAADRVNAAIERLPRSQHGPLEQRLLSVGRLGGVLPGTGAGNPPGCCVEVGGHLVCVR